MSDFAHVHSADTPPGLPVQKEPQLGDRTRDPGLSASPSRHGLPASLDNRTTRDALGLANACPELVCLNRPQHPFAAAVYRIRAALNAKHNKVRGALVLAVVSPNRADGRSVMAANLAIAFAQVHARTILVDGDLRNGRLHSMFNVGNDGGLARVLASPPGTRQDCVTLEITQLPLALVPTDTSASNPQALLSGAHFQAIVDELARQSDCVIIDTPAWNLGADAQLIAATAGTALIVARMQRTLKSDLQSMSDALATTNVEAFAVPLG